MPEPTAASLEAAWVRHEGAPARVVDLRRLPGGASRETWAFTVEPEDGGRAHLVLRRDPGGFAGTSERSVEYALVAAAGAAGVAVPRVRFLLDPGDGLGHGFVMDRVPGETIPRKLLRDDAFAAARPRIVGQCAEQLARIHRIDPAGLPDIPLQAAPIQVEQYRGVLDALGEPHPAFELALTWLDRHAPTITAPALVHGDFRTGNLVVGDDGVRAVLDWELAHRGDPAEDLGWFCVRSWRFGADDRPAGGFGSRAELLDAYAAAGGAPFVDAARLRYWELFGTVKWGVMCLVQAFTHLQGVVRSVELATLGRRVVETEWDVLELLGDG